MNPLLDELQQLIEYKFKEVSKLDQALVHRSSLNEHHQFDESNERYEFLGDAVLELWISDRLFNRFQKFDEGKLTNLRALVVCTQNLAKVASNFNLGKFIYLSHGEENHNGRLNQSILADTFEAILGSIYLDGGLDHAFKFLDLFNDIYNFMLIIHLLQLSSQLLLKSNLQYIFLQMLN